MGTSLTRPPLVEAILELKWQLENTPQGILVDKSFEVAHIRLANEVAGEFPFVEPLPSVQIPSQISSYITKYRYRTGSEEWPLIQLGPGIATLNFTKPYDWKKFLETSEKLVGWLHKAYSDHPLTLVSSQLRYINAEPFDFQKNDVLEFIQRYLHTEIRPPKGITDSTLIKGHSQSVSWSFEYPLSALESSGIVRFSTGTMSNGDSEDKKVVIWELLAQATGNHAPLFSTEGENNLLSWIDEAHEVIEKWFFTFIAGELFERYK